MPFSNNNLSIGSRISLKSLFLNKLKNGCLAKNENNMNRKVGIALLGLAFSTNLFALELPDIFKDNMVLQQQRKAKSVLDMIDAQDAILNKKIWGE